jgi:hypothetical protein
MDNLGGFGTGFYGTFNQHQAGNHARGIDYDQYKITHGHENGLFTGWYSGPFKDYLEIMVRGEESGNMNYVGVAKIMTAWGLGLLTSIYGDIPWSEAFDNEIEKPIYDSQESVYNEMIRLLTEGRANLTVGGTLDLSSGDFVFGGNENRWIAVSHALEARYKLHLGDLSGALAAVTAAESAGFTSTSGNLAMRWEGGAQHRNPWNTHWENNTVIASESFMQDLYESPVLTAYGAADTRDPRLEAYFDNSRFPDNDTLPAVSDGYSGINPVLGVADGYTGKPTGFGVTSESYSPVGPFGFFGTATSDHQIMTYYELKFIEAEAAVKTGSQARADAAFKDGAKASVDMAAPFTFTVWSSRGSDHPARAAEEAALTQRIQDYKDAIDAMSNVTLEEVMTEKYRAMFTVEHESWMDVRRYDYAYPSWLSIPIDGITGNPVAGQYIERMLYPQDELDKNASNVPDNGKGDNAIYNELWIMTQTN